MGWMGNIVSAAINTAGSVLDTAGSIACSVGGMGFAAAQAIDKTFQASYSGSAVGWGGLDVSGTLDHLFGINYTLPLRLSKTLDGQELYHTTDYVEPGMICMISSVVLGSGVILKSLGSTLKKFQQYREDAQFTQQNYGTKIERPAGREFMQSQLTSLSSSLTIAMLSYNTALCMAYYSSIFNSALRLTYPIQGTQYASGVYYHGPQTTTTYPIAVTLDPQQIIVDLPFIGNVTLLLNMALNGAANITAGAGVFFKENGPAPIAPLVTVTASAVGGSSAYLLSNFFAKKELEARDHRLIKAARKTVFSIQDEEEEALLTLQV
ncbi:MAG: hypothetical protein P4L79_07380 [Legionella sp.]|uniref:hypothetical protein n=1 Tax=Legionella sp. TaxID=459 RepID=UPI00284B1AB1|nr:hypothetical protein [Legionella sp.]